MAQRVEAVVKPSLLGWARETRGFSSEQAAKKLGVKHERLLDWEAGRRRPTIGQLRKAANVYKRPVAAFYLPEPPKRSETLPDFRRTSGPTAKAWSPELRLAVREALERRDAILEISRALDVRTVRLSWRLALSEAPEEAGARIRTRLNPSGEPRFGEESRTALFAALRETIEGLGILVFQIPKVAVSEMRAASLAEPLLPVILVNARDSLGGKVFSLFHELTHILLHDGGLCDFEGNPAARRIEAFCNHVAGSALVPAEELEREPIVARRAGARSTRPWSDEDLERLSRRFLVSEEVVLRRLVILRHASRAFYSRKRDEFLAKYAQRATSGGYAPPHAVAISRLGTRYVTTVLEAYRRDIITANEVSDHLGLKLDHLERVEQTVARRNASA